MLDTICMLERPTTTALVEYHSVSGDFGYDSTFYNRVYFYPFQGYPSLFMDGVDLWPMTTWRPSIAARVATPSAITLTTSGTYNSAARTGTINATFRNDSSATISARVYFIITEDSLYHLDPNGHAWHNHLARRFLPNTSRGDTMTLSPSQTKVKSRNFTIDPAWNANRCNIVMWVQADAPSYNVYQGGQRRVVSLTSIEEESAVITAKPLICLLTNPCVSRIARFSLELKPNSAYSIDIFDISGRHVKAITGITSQDKETVRWNLRNESGVSISSGVYLYRLTSGRSSGTGKIVVK